jgi:hypothetical protein
VGEVHHRKILDDPISCHVHTMKCSPRIDGKVVLRVAKSTTSLRLAPAPARGAAVRVNPSLLCVSVAATLHRDVHRCMKITSCQYQIAWSTRNRSTECLGTSTLNITFAIQEWDSAVTSSYVAITGVTTKRSDQATYWTLYVKSISLTCSPHYGSDRNVDRGTVHLSTTNFTYAILGLESSQ